MHSALLVLDELPIGRLGVPAEGMPDAPAPAAFGCVDGEPAAAVVAAGACIAVIAPPVTTGARIDASMRAGGAPPMSLTAGLACAVSLVVAADAEDDEAGAAAVSGAQATSAQLNNPAAKHETAILCIMQRPYHFLGGFKLYSQLHACEPFASAVRQIQQIRAFVVAIARWRSHRAQAAAVR